MGHVLLSVSITDVFICFQGVITTYHLQVRFIYRLTWEKGFGPCGQACSPTNIGDFVNGSMMTGPIPHLKWRYNVDNKTEILSDASYYVTSVSVRSQLGWEQGENAFACFGFQMSQSYDV